MSKGLCSKHAQQARARFTARTLPDLPGERWLDIDGHPGWLISSDGRVKSQRCANERLITPRLVNGRLFVDDATAGTGFSVHLQVLRTFRPDSVGNAVFIDGNVLNPTLSNLRWDTRAEKVLRAIAMADQSSSRWASDFAAYWRGDKHALDNFFKAMSLYLLKAGAKKVDSYTCWYRLNIEEAVHATLVRAFFSIHAATITSLDNIHGYLLTILDRILARNFSYTKFLVPVMVERDGAEVPRTDIAGVVMPSAELAAMARQAFLLEARL